MAVRETEIRAKQARARLEDQEARRLEQRVRLEELEHLEAADSDVDATLELMRAGRGLKEQSVRLKRAEAKLKDAETRLKQAQTRDRLEAARPRAVRVPTMRPKPAGLRPRAKPLPPDLSELGAGLAFAFGALAALSEWRYQRSSGRTADVWIRMRVPVARRAGAGRVLRRLTSRLRGLPTSSAHRPREG